MLYHTSPTKIENITKNGLFNDCLFFSSEPYSLGDIIHIYSINNDDMEFISVSQLHDESIINDIADNLEIDFDTAESLLNNSEQVWGLEIECDKAEADWMIQSMRGKCAKIMGYDGCKDRDEQGVVYIIPMFGRESILNLCDKDIDFN